MAPGMPPERIADDLAFEREHEKLMALMGRLEAATTPADVAGVVRELETLLPGHFAREEAKDGVFDWMLVLDPDLNARVVELTNDHSGLRASLDALSRGEGDVVANAHAFAASLRDHERREGDALRDAKRA